jgi:ribosomal protein S18 acetylase RimI-like enzyme
MQGIFSMAYATLADKPHFCNEWENPPENEFESKIRDKRCYVLRLDDKPIGYMRYNLIFDFIPFLTCFYIADPHKGKGLGKQAMAQWEEDMRSKGFKMIMVSTEADNPAQNFYRKLGYKDMGAIIMGGIIPYEQNAMEMFMGKPL